jgi:hypothetical protein
MQFEYLLCTIPAEFPTPELIFDGFVRRDGFMQTLIPTFEDFRDVLAFTFNATIWLHENVVNPCNRDSRSGSAALEKFRPKSHWFTFIRPSNKYSESRICGAAPTKMQ